MTVQPRCAPLRAAEAARQTPPAEDPSPAVGDAPTVWTHSHSLTTVCVVSLMVTCSLFESPCGACPLARPRLHRPGGWDSAGVGGTQLVRRPLAQAGCGLRSSPTSQIQSRWGLRPVTSRQPWGRPPSHPAPCDPRCLPPLKWHLERGLVWGFGITDSRLVQLTLLGFGGLPSPASGSPSVSIGPSTRCPFRSPAIAAARHLARSSGDRSVL